jgi:hypothetical protein
MHAHTKYSPHTSPFASFQFNPKLEASTVRVEKCRYMSSKMVPLWLVFDNADEQVGVITLRFYY